MKCTKCGFENKDEARFCGKCGEPLKLADNGTDESASEVPATEAQTAEVPATETKTVETPATELSATPTQAVGIMKPFRTLPFKKILQIVIPAVVLIILLIIVVPMLKGSHYEFVIDSPLSFTIDDATAIAFGSNNVIVIDGAVYTMEKSMDGSKAVCLADYTYLGGTLWYVTSSSKTKVADDVITFKMADSGNGIAYFTEATRDETATLYLYDCASKKSTLITDDACYNNDVTWISPDGKSIAFSTYGDSEDEVIGYVKINNRPIEELGKNIMCMSIADNGKYIYYMKINVDDYLSSALYVKKGADETKLMPSISNISGNVFLNKDYSQLVFDYDEKTYISRNGGEREKLLSLPINNVLLPKNAQTVSSDIIVCGVDKFANTVMRTSDGNLNLINNKYESSKISMPDTYDFGSLSLTTDGKKIVYLDYDSYRLYEINLSKEGGEKNLLGKDIANFVVTGDGKNVYYVNTKGELWNVKGESKQAKITDDVAHQYLSLCDKTNRVFYLIDYHSGTGTLCSSNSSGKRIRVQSANEVSSITSTRTNVFYYVNTESGESVYDVYRSNGNDNFVKFLSDVER